jgi:hypothetical protein
LVFAVVDSLMSRNHRFPLDIIKVTETVPLFSPKEAAEVISKAEAEGVHENEFKSGKYQLAGTELGRVICS